MPGGILESLGAKVDNLSTFALKTAQLADNTRSTLSERLSMVKNSANRLGDSFRVLARGTDVSPSAANTAEPEATTARGVASRVVQKARELPMHFYYIGAAAFVAVVLLWRGRR